MRPASVSGAASSSPAVSISRTMRPRNCASASLLSRVTPGVSATSAMRRPASRLNRVDLPTLGRPAMTTIGSLGIGSLGEHGSYLSAIRRASLVTSSTVPSATTGATGAAASDSVIWPRISPV